MSSEKDSTGKGEESGETSSLPQSSERPGPTSLLATMRSSQDEISDALLYESGRAARGPEVRVEEAGSDELEPPPPPETESRPLLLVFLAVLALGVMGALWWFAFYASGG